MKIKIVCVGKLKEKYLIAGVEEFVKRLKPYTKLEIIEVNETRISDNPSDAQILSVIEDEGAKLSKHIDNQDYVIVLDVDGKNINNNQYVDMIEKACLNGYSTFTFVIGGSYGLSQELKNQANFAWSFSKLVYTHQMIRLILVEQIYRGFRIMKNEPYHK